MKRYSRTFFRCSIVPTTLLSAVNGGCTSHLSHAPAAVDSITVSGLHILPGVAHVGSDQVRIDLRITNVSNTRSELAVALGCPVIVRFYRSGDSTKRPVWDQSLPRAGIECVLGIRTTSLLPGEQTVISSLLSVSDVLGDSLPDATYHATAELDWEFSPPVVVDVGHVRLSRVH